MSYRQRLQQAKNEISDDVREEDILSKEVADDFALDYDENIQSKAHEISDKDRSLGHDIRYQIKHELRKHLWNELRKKYDKSYIVKPKKRMTEDQRLKAFLKRERHRQRKILKKLPLPYEEKSGWFKQPDEYRKAYYRGRLKIHIQ